MAKHSSRCSGIEATLTNIVDGVVSHYGASNLAERILQAAAAAGVTEFTPSALAPVDEFHTGGAIATRQLAEFAGLKAGERVLDMGSGIGGPSRLLAAEFGCDVTGIDLTPDFVDAARVLTEKCGLSANCRFETGDATALPFDSASFDAAWTQHVVMNIRGRQSFYNEAFRVLKPGGRLAFFDLLLGDDRKELDFPLPWARTPDISFVHTAAETRTFLKNARFEEAAWQQVPFAQAPPPANVGGFGLALIMGEIWANGFRTSRSVSRTAGSSSSAASSESPPKLRRRIGARRHPSAAPLFPRE
jgi:ubiquinone/menaquinone biosynthesis C-methylase UbiE